MHEHIVERLSRIQDVQIEERTDSWNVRILHKSGCWFEIVLPKNCFEWFATLLDSATGKELWSDWSDWFVSGEVTKENRDEYYFKDIEFFISRVIGSGEFRVTTKSAFHLFGKAFFVSR